jgi:hypothetical protein
MITSAQRNGIMASTPTLTSRRIISQRRVSKSAEKSLLNPPPRQRRDTSIVSTSATAAAITNAAISPKTISRPLRSRFEGWPNCEGLEERE